jgi:threonine 3-dehydrogenase
MSATMKALRKTHAGKGLAIETVPVPSIGPADVLVRVKATSICGTDLHIYGWDRWSQGRIKPPVTLGHEFCGIVEKVGEEVTAVKPGDFVSAEMHVNCGHCHQCRLGEAHICQNLKIIGIDQDGAFAEFVKIPASNIWKLDPAIPEHYGAILDPLGNAVHTALAFDLVGEDVLITGAGPIGIMAAAVARHIGARHVVITDINPKRLKLAGEVADVVAVDVSKTDLKDTINRLKMKEGFDVALEMSGAPAAFDQLFDAIVTGGRVALLGLPAKPALVDWNKIIFKQLTIKGIYGREMFETWHKMIAMLESGLDVRKVITHRLPAEKFLEGFEIMRRGESGKIVLDWAGA